MIEIFKKNNSFNFFILILYVILLNFNLYLTPPIIHYTYNAPLSNFFYVIIKNIYPSNIHFLTTLYLILQVWQGSLLNNILEKYQILGNHSALSTFSYLLLLSFFNKALYLNPAFLSIFPLLAFLNIAFSTLSHRSYTNIFDMGMWVSIAALFYLPNIVFSIFLPIVLFVGAFLNWRWWIICYTGLLTPFLITGFLYFWNNLLHPQFLNNFLFSPVLNFINLPLNATEIFIKIGMCLTITALYIFLFQFSYLKNAQVRNYLTLLLYLLATSIISFLIPAAPSLEPAILTLIPISVFLAYTFQNISPKMISEFIHLIMLGILFTFQYNLMQYLPIIRSYLPF